MNPGQPSRLLQCGILFFGTMGLAFFGHGLYRFLARGNNQALLLIAALGLGLFLFCLLVRHEVGRKK